MDASQCAALLVSPLKSNELTLCARCYVRRVGINSSVLSLARRRLYCSLKLLCTMEMIGRRLRSILPKTLTLRRKL
ncbi:unnamed protein product [Brassica oleracea]